MADGLMLGDYKPTYSLHCVIRHLSGMGFFEAVCTFAVAIHRRCDRQLQYIIHRAVFLVGIPKEIDLVIIIVNQNSVALQKRQSFIPFIPRLETVKIVITVLRIHLNQCLRQQIIENITSLQLHCIWNISWRFPASYYRFLTIKNNKHTILLFVKFVN